MGDLNKKTTIDAPVEKVYAFVSDPYNAPKYISAILAIINGPTGAGKPGDTWLADCNFLGQKRRIALELTGAAANKSVSFVMRGEPRVSLSLRLDTVRSGTTRVALELDVPSVPGMLVNALMGGQLEGDLERLKRLLEK